MAHLFEGKEQGRAMFVLFSIFDTMYKLNNKFTVASCRGWGTDRDCKFFLTEADEAKARSEQHTQEAPSTPRTPVTRRTADLMQTPTTGSNSKVNLLARSGKARRVASASESPSAHRFIDADTDDGDEDDLASFVVELLGNEGIAMKSSTESLVRHVIAGRVGKYKAALKTSKDSLAFALEKLNELEGDGAV